MANHAGFFWTPAKRTAYSALMDQHTITTDDRPQGQGRGCFIAVVGPSGAGKDTLMRSAADRAGFMLARRVITKPAATSGEAFESVSVREFTRRRDAGEFAMSWSAHGFQYAISAGIETVLASGQDVLANLSRSVLLDLSQVFTPSAIVLVTAPPDILSQRLVRRNRENPAQIARRMARASFQVDRSLSPIVVDNSGSLEQALDGFVAACHAASGNRRIK